MIDRRRFAAVLTALVPLAAITLAGQPAGALPEEGDPITVEITGQDPLNPVPDGTLTIRGRVINNTDEPVADVEVLLRLSTDPLGSRSEVASVTDQTTTRRGTAISATTTPVTDELPASGATDFSITAPTSVLPFTGTGVYALFVEARTPDLGSFDAAIPITWFPNPEDFKPSRIVVATPLRAQVDLTANDALLSDALVSSMASGGSLSSLATASATASAAGIPISWLIDPAVTDAAARLQTEAATFPSSVEDAGDARDSAGAWLEAVADGVAAPTSKTYVTPFGEIDASAVTSADQPGLLQQSVAAAPQSAATLLQVQAGVVAIPPDGTTTLDTLTAYAKAGVTQVVLDSAASPSAQSTSYTSTGVGALQLPDGSEMTAIIPNDRLAANLDRPAGTQAERFRLQQGLLADAAMITLERPLDVRTVVLLPRQDLDLPADVYAGALTALSQMPYTQLVDLPALLADPAAAEARALALAESDDDRLSAEYLAPIPEIQTRLEAFSRVTVDPLAFQADFDAAILRSTSAQWRDDVDRGEALLGSVEADLRAEEQKVTTVSTGTVTFSGNTGTLPLTISNGLDQAVEVGVLLEADPAVRLTFTSPGLVRVDAGKRVSIEVPVEVFGSGPLPVAVILTDREGRPFIETGDLVIQSTATSMVAAAVAAVGGVALLVLILWRFRRKGVETNDEGP